MPRQVRQTLPRPPATYDQEYIARLADAVNRYMFQREGLGEMAAGRFICTDPVRVPGDLADTKTLPTGTIYLKQVPGLPGAYFLTVVTESDL